MSEPDPTRSPPGLRTDLANRIHHWIVAAVALVMTIDFALLLFTAQWLNAFLILMIMGVILAPTLLGERLPVKIPPELQVLAIAFSYAALFLGEVRDYYARVWWWDIVLHTTSGFLLGVLGFLLVYVLNENRRIHLYMRPGFVALFAFLFAVAGGALWEIFEFSMDSLFGTNMQKAMFDDPSGLTDTMWDLIVDTVGALTVSVFGWWYLRVPEESFIERWIARFIERNPRLFRH